MILCLYLILPFVSVLVKRFPVKLFVISAIVVYLSAVIMPFISNMSVVAGRAEVSFALKATNVFSFYLLYVLVGYWISNGLLS